MRHIRQTRDMNCGQSCVAIITGRTLREVAKVMGEKGTTNRQVLNGLLHFGFKPKATRFIKCRRPIELPKRALVRFAWEESYRKKNHIHIHVHYHSAVWWDGCWYDPGYAKGRCLLHKAMPEHCARMTSYIPL